MRLVISKHSKISEPRISRNHLSDKEGEIIYNKANEIMQMPIFISEKYPISLEEITAHANQVKRQHGLKVLVIDYLQMLYPAKNILKPQKQMASEIMIDLKQLAISLGVPIIIASQLSKDLESRKDKVPIISDFAEEAIAQYADKVLFLYRDDYYGIKKKSAKGIAHVIIAKNRNGALCNILLKYCSETNIFEDIE